MKLPCDPQRDLAPLTLGMSFPNVLVVHAGVGVKTFAEFIALAKKKPRTLDFASTGAGSASHLAGELLNQMAGIDTVHIPGAARPAGRPGGVVLLDLVHRPAACGDGQADRPGQHGPGAAGVPLR